MIHEDLICMVGVIFAGGIILVIGLMIDLIRIKVFDILDINSKCTKFCNAIRELQILKD